jgi:hypothetical protein
MAHAKWQTRNKRTGIDRESVDSAGVIADDPGLTMLDQNDTINISTTT